jgi:hypothetical protein
MNKKILIMSIAMIMQCVVAFLVFADGESISFNSNSVTVTNTNKSGKITVEVCVTLKDSRGRESDTTWAFYDIQPGRSQTQKVPGGTIVTAASSTYCSIPAE